MQKLSSDAMFVLETLVDRGYIWADEAAELTKPHILVYLVKHGYAVHKLPDSNFLHLLTTERQNMLYYAPSAEGVELLRRHRDELADKIKNRAHEEAKEKTRERTGWIKFFLGYLLGWLCSGFTPAEVLEYILSLFH